MNSLTEQTDWKVSKARDMAYGEPYIRGRYGIIRQYLDGDLDVWVTNIRIFNRLSLRWPPKKRFDDGGLFIRPFNDLHVACAILKARKRRKVSIQMRERGRILAERAKMSRLASRASQ